MTGDDIRLAKSMIDTIAQLALLIPRDHATAVLDAIGRHETLQPILDPTGYREISGTIPGHRQEVEAFLAFRAALEELRSSHPAAQEAGTHGLA